MSDEEPAGDGDGEEFEIPERWKGFGQPPPDDANRVRSGNLDGKVALITGGASGIGEAVAVRLAAGGARVVIADVDAEAGEKVAHGIDGSFVRCDVRELADCEAAVAHAESVFGGLDLAILNAGVISGTTIDELDEDLYRRIVAINLDGVVLGSAAALPALRRRGGGTIIATASMAGVAPFAGDPFYSATKHAVVGFVRSLGQQVHHLGIMVQAVCPSFTDTPIIAPAREMFTQFGLALLTVDDVVPAFVDALDCDTPGECFHVVQERPPGTIPFHKIFQTDEPATEE